MYTYVLTDNSKINPRELEILVGQSAMFSCISNYQVKWFFNHADLPINAEIFQNNSIYLRNARLFNQGVYLCESETDEENIWSGIKGNFSAQAFLTVKGMTRANYLCVKCLKVLLLH